ncbi:MAG: class I SAM-dependent methyltransferase [Gammaproteobacteria bacterium]|nr:class I SAM-dependent methyltransferase [Gammaproteobacteria bacterium]
MTTPLVSELAWWEDYFAPGGGWERHGGREQTRRFAQQFVRRSGLERDGRFSLLDVGCALGEALRVFAEAFPQAQLWGVDFSPTAVARSRAALGTRAHVEVASIESVRGPFDVVYCSNTLEHFVDYADKARMLLRQCARQLFVMVPYLELRDGKPLQPDPREHHQHSFERDTFDFLVSEGLAADVQVQVFACPGAWGWSLSDHVVQRARNVGRAFAGRPTLAPPRQILYAIRRAADRAGSDHGCA